MSQNNVIIGSLDYFNLLEYPLTRYFFKLDHFPIIKSLIVSFDGYNKITQTEWKIIKIVDKVIENDDNVTYIKYDSDDCDVYNRAMIGSTLIANRKRIKITEENYKEYTINLVDCTYIDFTLSEKIKNILHDVDEFGNRVCTNFTASYFYSF